MEHLQFRRCHVEYNHANDAEVCDMPTMLRTLEQQIPRPARFEWSEIMVRDRFRGFDTFKNLSCLRELHVDSPLFDPASWELFPESLQYVNLDFVTVEQLEWMMDTYRNVLIQAETDKASSGDTMQLGPYSCRSKTGLSASSWSETTITRRAEASCWSSIKRHL